VQLPSHPTAADGARCQNPTTDDGEAGRCWIGAHNDADTEWSDTVERREPDVGAPEGNDRAAGNPGGGAPELNTNAQIHGGFADWEKAYERFDDETREYVDRLAADMQETAAEHAPKVSADRRERLAKEKATRGSGRPGRRRCVV
jgi:hypothetical protein